MASMPVRRPPSAQRSLSPEGLPTAYDERAVRQGAGGRAILVDVAACTRISQPGAALRGGRIAWGPYVAAGRIFWLLRKRFVGSYVAFSAASRS